MSSVERFAARIGGIMLTPKDSFLKVAKEDVTILEPIFLSCILVAINAVLFSSSIIRLISLISAFYPAIGTILYKPILGGIIGISLLVSSVVGVLIQGSVVAAIMHLFAKALDGEGSFSSILRVSFYSYLPYSLLVIPLSIGLIFPIVGILLYSLLFLLIFIWQLYIAYSGIKSVYNLSSSKAFIVLLSPVILVVATIFLLPILLMPITGVML
jgi:hypothetical protein